MFIVELLPFRKTWPWPAILSLFCNGEPSNLTHSLVTQTNRVKLPVRRPGTHPSSAFSQRFATALWLIARSAPVNLRLYPLGLLGGRLACHHCDISIRGLTLGLISAFVPMACHCLPCPLFGVRLMLRLCPNWAASAQLLGPRLLHRGWSLLSLLPCFPLLLERGLGLMQPRP